VRLTEGLLHDSFGLLNCILDPPDEIGHEPLGYECLCATPIQEFPSDVVGLFRAVLKDLSNLRQSDIQSFGSAPHDSSNFARVSNELFERFSDPNELQEDPNQHGRLEEQQNCDQSYKDRLQ
jgi:hypothetical protein